MKFKNTGAQKSTITRDVNDFVAKTDVILKSMKESGEITKIINKFFTN